MEPWRLLRFCPRCGRDQGSALDRPLFNCDGCGFHYYFGPTVAAAAIIVADDGRVLLIRRAKEPARGKLAIPGGFVDVGETAEEALRREVREEVNVELDAIRFLSSHPNQYHYRGVTYPVLDLFFAARPRSVKAVAALDAVESVCWLKPEEVRPEDLAFPSMQAAWALWRGSQSIRS